MKIALAGDAHGNPKMVSSKSWPEGKEYGPKDLVIFLGDFGLFWSNPPSKEETYWLEWLAEKEYTVAFVDGNHENFDVIDAFPEEEKWEGNVGVYETKLGPIYHLKRGEVYQFDPDSDEKFLAIPKALSIDKAYRTEGRSWWSGESLSAAQETNTLDNLDLCDWKVKTVLTHTIPDSVVLAFVDNPNSPKFHDPVAKFLEFIANKLEFEEWHFGHFHNDRAFTDAAGDTYSCHYTKVHGLQGPE